MSGRIGYSLVNGDSWDILLLDPQELVTQGFHVQCYGRSQSSGCLLFPIEIRRERMITLFHMAFLTALGATFGDVIMQITSIQSRALNRILKLKVGAKSVALATHYRPLHNSASFNSRVNFMLMFIEILFPVNNVFLWLSIQKFVCNGHLIMADQTADGQLDESYHVI